jgi:hypothetical protein
MSLSIVTVTRGENHVWPFISAMNWATQKIGSAELIVCADGKDAMDALMQSPWRQPAPYARFVTLTESPGYVEAIIDEAFAYCRGDYVLRLDDDETPSMAMMTWLKEQQYLSDDVWRFPRVHFWKNVSSVLITKALWPDWQIRLTTKAKAGGREKRPHSPSPFGIGSPAPVCLEHHKFLIKSREQRQEVAARYDAAKAGLGTGPIFKVYSLPEEVYGKDPLELVQYSTGQADWTPTWRTKCTL